MLETIEAIYLNGTFKPLHPVDLPEGIHVQVNTNISSLLQSANEAQRRALRYVLMNHGDALSVGAPSLQGQDPETFWSIDIRRTATNELCGVLRLSTTDYAVITWLPSSLVS